MAYLGITAEIADYSVKPDPQGGTSNRFPAKRSTEIEPITSCLKIPLFNGVISKLVSLTLPPFPTLMPYLLNRKVFP